MRYCLVQDENCHWYCIRAEQREEFDKLLREAQSDDYDKFEDKFGMSRIDGPHRFTFTDPKEG